MATTTIHRINVLAAGRNVRREIAEKTGVALEILDKYGCATGSVFEIRLAGKADYVAQAKSMLDESETKMYAWAERQKQQRVQQRMHFKRTQATKDSVVAEKPVMTGTTKVNNAFAGLIVEEIQEPPKEAVVETKLSKAERQKKNKKFQPFVLEEDMSSKLKLPTQPKLSWGEVSDSDSNSDSDEDDGEGDWTVVA
jgi:hypothetical protein